MTKAFNDIWEVKERFTIPMRKAAYVNSIEKIVKNMEAFNEWRFNMGQLLGDEFPMKEWLKKFSAVKNYLKDNTIVEYKPDDGYFSAHIYKQEGDLLIERLHVDCKTNPVLDKKIIEDIIKSMTL